MEFPKRLDCKKGNATLGDENSLKKTNHNLNIFRFFLMPA